MTDSIPLLIAVGGSVLAAAAVLWMFRHSARNRGKGSSCGAAEGADEPNGQVLERLRTVVRGRPARERLVLMLTEFERLSPEDTADVLGIPVEQVIALHHSIRGALHAAAEGEEVPASSLEPSRAGGHGPRLS